MNPYFATTFVTISILGLIFSPSMQSINAAENEIMSPRKQMAAGVAAEDVMCKTGLVLMIRTTNGAAACVKPSTSMKLSDVGWGSIIESAMIKETTEDDTEENGRISDTIEAEIIEEDSHEKKVEFEEGLSMGDEEGMEEEPIEEVPFTIGGIDLSMAAPLEGDEDAPITIIEFGDYQCPNCKGWFQNEKSTITADYILTGVAKLYFVDFTFLGDDSIISAQAAYCADDQGKFTEYHSTLYNNQAGIQDGWANSDSLKQFATELGLDSEIFNECLDSGKYSERVSYNTNVGASNDVEGTPHFFLVGPEGDIKQIAGPQPAIVFDAAINSLGY